MNIFYIFDKLDSLLVKIFLITLYLNINMFWIKDVKISHALDMKGKKIIISNQNKHIYSKIILGQTYHSKRKCYLPL